MPSKSGKKWRGTYTDINRTPQQSKPFETRIEAVNWEIKLREAVKQEKARIKNSKTVTEQRKENLKKSGNNFQTEATATLKFCELLKDQYNFLQVRDGAKSDLALQFKSNNSNKYYALQVKSCSKRDKENYINKDGSSNNKTPRAYFNYINKYPNSIVLCILLEPFTIWMFNGENLLKKKKLHESQKTDFFQNGLIYDEEKNINRLHKLKEYLTSQKNGYARYAQEKIEYWDVQLAATQYIEHKANQLYQQHWNKTFDRRKIGELENQPYDLIENGKKIQEKICTIKGTSAFEVSLCKKGGSINGKKSKKVPYEKNDFDVLRVYVLYTLDKENKLSFKKEDYRVITYSKNEKKYRNAIKDIDSWKLFGHFDFPMKILIEHKLIHTENTKGQVSFVTHLPKDILQSLGYKKPIKCKNDWTREYFIKI